MEKIERLLQHIFGVPRLNCGTSRDWKIYRTMVSTQFPVYNAIMRVVDKIDDIVHYIGRIWRDEIKYPIIYRTTDKYHIIDTKLKPNYYEVDTLMLHGCFSLLVDYVEHQCAWMQHTSVEKSKRSKFKPNREQGMEYLTWEMSLTCDENYGLKPGEERYGTPTPQAISAKEIMELYTWWVDVHEKRQTAYDLYWDKTYGDETYCEVFDNHSYSKTKYDLMNELEDKYEKEDEEMLIRLIKIRRSMWI